MKRYRLKLGLKDTCRAREKVIEGNRWKGGTVEEVRGNGCGNEGATKLLTRKVVMCTSSNVVGIVHYNCSVLHWIPQDFQVYIKNVFYKTIKIIVPWMCILRWNLCKSLIFTAILRHRCHEDARKWSKCQERAAISICLFWWRQLLLLQRMGTVAPNSNYN